MLTPRWSTKGVELRLSLRSLVCEAVVDLVEPEMSHRIRNTIRYVARVENLYGHCFDRVAHLDFTRHSWAIRAGSPVYPFLEGLPVAIAQATP